MNLVAKKKEENQKGKILKKNEKISTTKEVKPNIVLHFKCKTTSLNDLYNFNNTLYNQIKS